MDLLNEAFSRLDLLQVGRALGVDLKVGVQSRPGDEKESKPSFSVFIGRDGKLAFKDQARGNGGGVWQLVQLLRPEWSKKEVAEWLIVQAGLDPADGKVSDRQRRADFTRQRTEVARAHFKELDNLERLPALDEWPSVVKGRYASGWGENFTAERRQHLADERGWPVEWVDTLVADGKLSDPLCAWFDRGSKGAQRGFAFLVQRPGRDGQLVSVGYHQRFRRSDGRAWIFCPYTPRKEPKSLYQRKMMDLQVSTSPFPFVLGDPGASLWVVLEGQWDACSFYFLWMQACPEIPVFVVGIRGANGFGVFLSAWAEKMREVSPKVWAIGDNDVAGKGWNARKTAVGEYGSWSFLDRLRHWAGSEPAFSSIPGGEGFDLNDWLRSVGDVKQAGQGLKYNFKKAFMEVENV